MSKQSSWSAKIIRLFVWMASMYVTLVVLLLLIAWMLLGAYLGSLDYYKSLFAEMNDQLVVIWWLNNASAHTGMWLWLSILWMLIGAFTVNLISCLWNRLWIGFATKFRLTRVMLFVMHVAVVLVMICHALIQCFGFKDDKVILAEGETYIFNSDYSMELMKIDYNSDLQLLKIPFRQRRRLMTRTDFPINANSVQIKYRQLNQASQPPTIHRLAYMTPMLEGDVQISLTGFDIAPGADGEHLTVEFAISISPFRWFFIISYAFMVFVVFCYIGVIWNQKT